MASQRPDDDEDDDVLKPFVPDFQNMVPEGREYHRCLHAVVTALQAVSSEGDLTEALKQSFAELALGFGAQKALLLAVENGEDAERISLKNVSSAGLTPEQITSLEAGESLRGVSHTIIRDAIRTRAVRVMEHPAFRRLAGITKAFTAQDDFSVLCAPIFDPDGRRVVAVMYFQNSGPYYKSAYRTYDLRFVEPYREALQRVLHLHFQKEQTEKEYAALLQGQQPPDDAPEIIGNSPSTAELRRIVHEVWIPSMEGENPAPILIRGETGTGKDVLARYLHAWSARRDGPFVAVNGGEVSTSPDMVKSALHGHTRNAFTGAMREEPGSFRSAEKGVLFIDEVGELSEQGQLSLLRTLDNSRVTPLGDTKEYPVDVMVVLATNRDLEEAAKEGRLKRDFLARFETQTILITPLRERPADVLPLIEHFIRQSEKKAKKKTLGLTDQALDAMLSYSWPANVREVRDVCRLLVNRARPGGRIDQELLEQAYPRVLSGSRNPAAQLLDPQALHKTAMARFEKELLQRRLDLHRGNVTLATETLGWSHVCTFYRACRRLGIKVKDFRTPGRTGTRRKRRPREH